MGQAKAPSSSCAYRSQDSAIESLHALPDQIVRSTTIYTAINGTTLNKRIPIL